MAIATLTSKGQIVIPKPIRDRLDLRVGDQLDFILQEDGTILLRPATEDVKSLKGALERPGRRTVSVAEMHEAIRQRAKGSK